MWDSSESREKYNVPHRKARAAGDSQGFLVRNRLYSQNALIWCIFLETLEDRADGAEGVSGLVVEGGYADAGAEGRDRRDFGGSVSWGSLLCRDRTGHWRRSLLPALWSDRGGGQRQGAGIAALSVSGLRSNLRSADRDPLVRAASQGRVADVRRLPGRGGFDQGVGRALRRRGEHRLPLASSLS